MSIVKARPTSIDMDRDLTPQQRAVANGLAEMVPVEEIAEQLGIEVQHVHRMARSQAVLAAIGARAVIMLHKNSLPAAIRTIDGLLNGLVLQSEIDRYGRKKTIFVKAPVPPAVRLAAAQAVIKLSGIDQEASPADLDEDLAAASPERLRAIIGAIEDKLAKTAQDVTPVPHSAPNDAEEAEIVSMIPDGYSVLD